MLKIRKRGFIAVIILSFIIIGNLSKSLANENPNVAVVIKDLNSQYWEIVKAGVEKGFQDFGVNGKVLAPSEPTVEMQIALLKQVLIEEPDVLVVSPILPSETIPVLEEFVDKNIPVLFMDTDYPWENKTSYIGTDNIELGKKAGALIASQLQPGDKVALIGGDLRVPVVKERLKGARLELKNAGIISVEVTGIPEKEYAYRYAMETILHYHPDVKGVITATDNIALGALKVIEEQDLGLPVTGADGIIEVLELIEQERITGSVAQNPYDMGYLSIDTASKVSKGETVEENVDSGVDILIKGNAEKRLNFLKELLR